MTRGPSTARLGRDDPVLMPQACKQRGLVTVSVWRRLVTVWMWTEETAIAYSHPRLQVRFQSFRYHLQKQWEGDIVSVPFSRGVPWHGFCFEPPFPEIDAGWRVHLPLPTQPWHQQNQWLWTGCIFLHCWNSFESRHKMALPSCPGWCHLQLIFYKCLRAWSPTCTVPIDCIRVAANGLHLVPFKCRFIVIDVSLRFLYDLEWSCASKRAWGHKAWYRPGPGAQVTPVL